MFQLLNCVYLLQHPIVELPRLVVLPHCEKLKFRIIKNYKKGAGGCRKQRTEVKVKVKVKMKLTLELALKGQGGRRG